MGATGIGKTCVYLSPGGNHEEYRKYGLAKNYTQSPKKTRWQYIFIYIYIYIFYAIYYIVTHLSFKFICSYFLLCCLYQKWSSVDWKCSQPVLSMCSSKSNPLLPPVTQSHAKILYLWKRQVRLFPCISLSGVIKERSNGFCTCLQWISKAGINHA